MSDSEDTQDDERERVIRYVKFMGFVLVLTILWYSLGIADGL